MGGKMEAALDDVEQAIKELPDPNANGEAVELKKRITEQLKRQKQPPAQAPSQPAPGFKRMQIVEANDDSDEDAVQETSKTPPSPKSHGTPPAKEVTSSKEPEMFPEIVVEHSRQGIEKAKSHANTLFSQGSLEESVRWFSKGVWLVESKRVTDVPSDLQSILHSNRAFAYIKLKKWVEAEEDCSAALALNAKNTKAKYRRSMARF